MQSIRQVQRLNDLELEKCVPSNASWHTDYRDTAYVYIGGLPFELSEGDILTLFSQYGNPVHINLVRDKETGKSRGFCFLKYEDQRSCDLAVDNLSGAGVMGRVLSVDHTRYKKKEGEVETVGDDDQGEEEQADDTDQEADSRRKRRRTDSASESDGERPMLKEEVELAKLMREHDDDDPMKAYLVKEKKAEVAEALKAVVKQKEAKSSERKHRHRHHHRTRRDERHDDRDRSIPRRSETNGRRRSRSPDEDRSRRHTSHRSRRERDRSRSRTPLSEDDRGTKQRSTRERDYSGDDVDRERRRRRREERSDRSRSR